MAVHKYGSMGRNSLTEIWKPEEGWLYRNIGSMRRDGCTEIWKHEEGGCTEI